MMKISRICAKLGTPTGYLSTIIVLTVIGWASYSCYWGPIRKRRNRETAEEYANYVYDKMKAQEQQEHQETLS